MSLFLEAAVKFSLVLLIAIVAVFVLRRGSAALRHWVLAAAMTCGLALPVLELIPPMWQLPLAMTSLSIGSSLELTGENGVVGRGPASAGGDGATAAVVTRGAARASLPLFATVWLAGVSVGLAVLCIGLIRLWRLASRSQVVRDGRWRVLADLIAREYGLSKPVRLLRSEHPTLLVTWGVVQPTVLLPAAADQWTDERIRVVLGHELAHVKRGDWVFLLIAAVLRSIYWFSPMLWIACSRLRYESERACDDIVLKAGVSGAAYAEHLLGVARDTVRLRRDWSPAAAIAHPSMLEGRIRAMLNTQLNREPLSLVARIGAAIGVTTLTLAIAGAGVSTMAAPAPTALITTPTAPSMDRSSSPTPGLATGSARSSAAAVPASAAPVNRNKLSNQAAQSGPGSIDGVLHDQLGGLLPGASVSLTDAGTGATYQTLTDRSGAFIFRALPPSDYEMVTQYPGFASVKTIVTVRAGDRVQIRLAIPIGSLTETVSVTPERGAAGASISPRSQSVQPRSAPPLPQAQRAIPFSGEIGGQIQSPVKLVHVAPIYPAAQQAAGITGVVVLLGRVGIDGYIVDLKPRDLESKVDPALTAAAIEAARQWKFTPTLLNGVPVDVNITINVQFGLP